MKEHVIKIAAHGPWMTGTIDGHTFGIKVADIASGFGIAGGRVIKLYVNSRDGSKGLVSYERGWELEAVIAEQESLVDALLCFAASLPMQDVWQRTFKVEREFYVDVEAGSVLEVEADEQY